MASNNRKSSIEKEYSELIDAQVMIDSPLFKKYFIEPMEEKIEKLKRSYECDTIEELQRIRGQYEGLSEFFKNIKLVEEDIRILNHELKNL